ncbi:type II toxin-antitoxin system VapC family toxin [Rhizobium sp. CC-YZS058]|nr:type II toxin-antitoxin system VapC family toxin [Rhizobium sp. CC-YZS058]MEA3535308.1 type II toxin-antitoxin system VapC family toxin [Rhizobium sp. CC-YZS058]
MFIDASALTAMLADEEEAPLLLVALFNAPTRVTSPLSI